MPKYLRSVTRKLSQPSSGLACGLRVPGITEAGPAASVWNCGACRDDSRLWKPASPLAPAPDTQSRCQKSLTQWVAVLCYCRRQRANHFCWFMGLMVSSFLLLSPGLEADVLKVGPSCV